MKKNIYFILIYSLIIILFSCTLNHDKDIQSIDDWAYKYSIGEVIKYSMTDTLLVHYVDDTTEIYTSYLHEYNVVQTVDSIYENNSIRYIKINETIDGDNSDSFYYIIDRIANVIRISEDTISNADDRIVLKTPVLEGVQWQTKNYHGDSCDFTLEAVDSLININDNWYNDMLIISTVDAVSDSFAQYMYSTENGIIRIRYSYRELFENYEKIHKYVLLLNIDEE